MPRAAKPEGLRILDYFNTAELGEAKVIASLAMETITRRYQQKFDEAGGANSAPAPRTIKRRTRRAAPAVAAAVEGTATQTNKQEAVS